MELTGAQILLESLKKEGVDVLFGYPGGAVLDIYDELPRHPDLKHILVRHEQGAVHAADGYARASGKVGVCLVTSGPGATNTVTGIATAYCDSIPLVLISGQVATHAIGSDAFQECDAVGITRPCVKHNFLVKDIRKLAKTIRQAFYLARSGRPGPVLVDLPKDVMQAHAEFVWPEDIYMRSYNPTYKPNLNQLRRAVEVLAQARRPMILAGGGVIMSDAADSLRELAHALHLPVSCTLMGLGAFPATDDLWLGMVGMHGSYAANMDINNADVLVCVGARFDDRVTGKISAFASHARIIHIDSMLDIANSKMAHVDWKGDHESWLETVAQWKQSKPFGYIRNDHIKPQHVIEELYALTGGEAIITTEVGQNQMWAAQFYSFTRPRTLLTSGGLGTMGYGFPASIGAQCAFPDRKVIAVAGDGSIQMNIQELATVVQYKLPIKVIILNNRHLGMVRQWQELFYDRNYSFTNMEAQPDFVKLAEAYGAEGYRISQPGELRPVLEAALSSPHPAFVDVTVEREENVYPMVPAGAALDEMLLV